MERVLISIRRPAPARDAPDATRPKCDARFYVGVDSDVESACGESEPSDPDLSAAVEWLAGEFAERLDVDIGWVSPAVRCCQEGDGAKALFGVCTTSPKSPPSGKSHVGAPTASKRAAPVSQGGAAAGTLRSFVLNVEES
mmetsp:Transcript_54330/g.126511  ORF Transcript_54330/g.126511 Transcript_54330/m.126511 type:complete len:140 (+) Transcript_54330:97-516(+)